jgi:hypothetical protein
MNNEEILRAKSLWDLFYNNLPEVKKNEFANYIEPIESLNIYAYYISKDFIKFDQAVNILSKQYLFDDNLIPVIYACYVDRGSPDLALTFIDEALKYHEEEGISTELDLHHLRNQLMNQQLFDKLKISLSHLRNLPPEKIPGILPLILNGQYQLNLFILGEILLGLKTLSKKIKALNLSHENFISDIFISTLKLRFPIWGWDIKDQERSGSSVAGKDAGEVDCTITAAGIDLTLVEAFILTGLNTSKITEHIFKCEGYISNLSAYYIVVYYTGPKLNFDSTWESYKEVVKNIAYTTKWKIDAIGFTSLEHLFTNVENIKIAKTKHERNELFHVMIDLSES